MSLRSSFTDKAGHKINLLEYDPKYSSKLIRLATVVDEFVGLGGMVYAKRIFDADYHAKVQKYKDSVIIFAEHEVEKEEGSVCGSVELGIKEAWIDDQICRIGIISDLRVHPQYWRQGLGSKLMEQIEEIGKKRGITMFYLLAPQNNEKIRALAGKLGFNPSNQADVLTYELSKHLQGTKNVQVNNQDVIFREINKIRAKELIRKYCEKKDFFLSDVDEYFENPDYEGTYIAETADGETYGGINLFKSPTETRMVLQRLFIPSDFAFNKWMHVPVMSAFSLFAATLYFVLNGKFGVNPKTTATITIGLNIGILIAYTRLVNTVRRMSGREPKCRYVGLFYKGNEESKKEIFNVLFSHLENLAYNKGYRITNANFDKNDLLKQFFPKSENYLNFTLFNKFANEAHKDPAKNKVFSNFSFYDPRDW